MSRQTEFIEKLAPMVVAEAKRSKILPSLTIAQACLKTGYGKHLIGGNALFGIKGKGTLTTTKEYINGQWITIKDSFRDYNSWEESIADHSEFIHTVKLGNGQLRYRAVIGETDYKKACRAIFAAGYATGKDYDNILIGIVEMYKLYKYDNIKQEYQVRVFSFGTKEKATAALARIRNLNYFAQVEPLKNEFQVRVFTFSTKDKATAALVRIKNLGYYAELEEIKKC